MHPIICVIGPFTVYAYGFMLAGAFLIGLTLASVQARKHNIHPEIIHNLSLIVFSSGVAGARILYIVQNLRYYARNPGEIIMLQYGGLSWFGGLACGIVSGAIYIKRRRLGLYKTMDLIMPFVALAQAIGRIGCFLNGCCFGKVSRFGVYFEAHKASLAPTQAYSSLLLIAIFIILRFIQEKPHREGTIFFLYLLLYSLKRFVIEFWRADHETILLGLSLFQIISVVIFCLSLLKLCLIKKSEK